MTTGIDTPLHARARGMSLRRLVQLLFGALVLLALTTALIIVFAVFKRRTLVETQRTRFVSYQLADELRQSSDDLTRFARTYVVTGDPAFERYYRDVLAIRNGEKPRPEHYERVYWDLLVPTGRPPNPDGARVPLRELMKQAGVTDEELATLQSAEATSNSLVGIEETAMHAFKGEYRDATGAFTVRGAPDQALAIRLMHDAAYHREKAGVMGPIDEFLAMVEARTASELQEFNRTTVVVFGTIEGLLAVFIGLVVASYPVMKRRVLVPVSELQQQTGLVAADLERLASVTTQIANGDLDQSFTVSAAPMRSARGDEIGELARVHDSMIEQLQTAGSAIAAIMGELSQARHQLEGILNKTPIAVGISVDGSARYVNPRFHELFGMNIGDPATGFYANADDRAPILAEMRQHGMVSDYIVEAQAKDGRRLDVLCTYYPIEFDGGSGVLAWIIDITKMKNTEKALEQAKLAAEAATKAKSAFLATMSHEIRTPMNAVLGYTQLLKRDRSLTPDQRHKIDAILASGEHLLTLINNVLEMSRIEAGRSVVAREPVDLYGLLDGVEQMFIPLTRQKGLQLVFKNHDDLPGVVEGDPGKIRQVVINLLSNATKFTSRGGISVRTSSQRIPQGGHAITIAVEDTGSGIADQNVARIFGAFEQTSGGAGAGGTGLGLTIGKELAHLMGGDLTVVSEVGVGSTFTFTFEAGVSSADAARAVAGGLPIGLAADQPRRKILVTDDQKENREIAEELLTRVGFETRVASSGEEAIVVHDRWRPDLVLMDIRMPGIDGFEAIRQLRTAGSAAVLVAFTASVLGDMQEEAAAAGANGVLRKPYREAELLRAIGDWLGVTYVYEDEAAPISNRGTATTDARSLAHLLTQVPADLRRQLHAAATQARTARVEALAAEVEKYSAGAAEGIRVLSKDFRFEDLAAALEPATSP